MFMNNILIQIIPGENGTLSVKIPFHPGLLACIRSIPGRRWNNDAKTWHIANLKESLDKILLAAIAAESSVYIGRHDPFSLPRRITFTCFAGLLLFAGTAGIP